MFFGPIILDAFSAKRVFGSEIMWYELKPQVRNPKFKEENSHRLFFRWVASNKM